MAADPSPDDIPDIPELRDRDESWPVRESVDLHRDGWVMALRADTITAPGIRGDDPDDGAAPFRRWVLEHPGAVVVLAVDDDDRVVLLSQYRHPARRRFIELPAGLIDGEGEEPIDVARRELREETGLVAQTWTPLSSLWSSPGISAEVMHLFLARGLSDVGRGDFHVEHEEADMQVFRAPWDDVVAAVLDGALGDAPLVSAVLLAQVRGLVGGGS